MEGRGGGREGDGVKAVGKKTARGETAPRTGKDESKNSIDNPGKKRSNHRGARSQIHDKLTCNQIRCGRIGGDTAHDRADRGRGAVMHTQAPECFALPEGDKSGTREGWARRPRQKKTVRIFSPTPFPFSSPFSSLPRAGGTYALSGRTKSPYLEGSGISSNKGTPAVNRGLPRTPRSFCDEE